MNFGLIAIALIFISVALLIIGRSESAERKKRTENRLEAAMTKSADPLRVEKDPLKKKFVPQWVTDNFISAGIEMNQQVMVRVAGVLLGPALLLWVAKGPANAAGALMLSILGLIVFIIRRQRKRRKKMLEQLPSFLDSVVRVSAVGYSVTVSFNTALEQAESPLKDSLGVAVQMQFAGLELDEAMQRLARIFSMEEFKLIASVVSLALTYGGKSDILLGRLAQYLRDREQFQQEMMSMSSEARTSAIFMCLLTPMLVALIMMFRPEYIGSMWDDPTGRQWLFIGAGLQTAGAFWIYRIVKGI
ncbi:MAG: type II secretion system F family protein [Limnobacter sp.]|nr:type II secretion system F family protein [Limnobacter sp.]